MFEYIPIAQADPILGLVELYHNDNRSNKINLSIGIYQDETGNTPILTSVKKAEELLLKNETSKNYLSIDGIEIFRQNTQKLLFGESSHIITDARARCVQSIGGTNALRTAADFLVHNTGVRRVWISNPAWPNYKNIFNAAGLEVCYYDYYDTIKHKLDFTAMLISLKQAQTGDLILLNSCCHNPTGMDLSVTQWNELATLSLYQGWLPLFDIAYQGFSQNLQKDVVGLNIFCKEHEELIVCSSYSKNFSLYNERVGACTLVSRNSKVADHALSQLKTIIRANYSNPPAHGAAIVTTILSNNVLYNMWKQELRDMRKRIQHMRYLFVNTLIEKGSQQDFSFINEQNGMFSLSGLNQEQVLKLRYQSGIYLMNSGRINIAGMTKNNMEQLCEAIVTIL